MTIKYTHWLRRNWLQQTGRHVSLTSLNRFFNVSKRNSRSLWSAVQIILVVLTLYIWTTLFSSLISIKSVIVEGNEELLGEVDKLRGKNLLLIDEKWIAKDILSRHLNLQSVAVKKHFPDRLSILAVNRKAILQIAYDSHYFMIDASGVVFRSYTDKQNLPELRGLFSSIEVGSVLDIPRVENLLAFVAELFEGDIVVENVRFLTEGTARIDLFSGISVLYSLPIKPQQAASSLQIILRGLRIEGKSPRVIDLRYDKPVLSF